MTKIRGKHCSEFFKQSILIAQHPQPIVFRYQILFKLPELCLHGVYHPPPGKQIPGPDNITQKINALCCLPDPGVFFVKRKVEPVRKHMPDLFPRFLKIFRAAVQKKKIITVADIHVLLQGMLDKLVKLIEIEIGKKLAGKIPHGQPRICFRMKEAFVRWQMLQQLFIAFYNAVFYRIIKNNLLSYLS